MRSQARVTALLLVLSQTVLAGALAAQETHTVRGRALDEATRQPIPDVLVRILDLDLSALTGMDGRFQIDGVPLGTYIVRLEHLAYGEHLRPLVVRSGEEPTLVIHLSQQPIALDSIVVEARTELEQRRQSTGFAMNEIGREDLDTASREGLNLWQLLDAQMPQVSVSDGSRGIAACVEFRGSANLRGGCNHMAIFIDGVPMTAPGTVYPNIPLNDIERVEAISPGQAGVQYGTMGGAGVLLIETRTGPRADRARDAREVLIAFDWSGETQPYPWAKAAGGSVLANAIGLAVGFAAAQSCLNISRNGLLGVDDCGGLKAFAAGSLAVVLPVIGSSYLAGWGGETDRSRGRLIPAAVLSSAAAMTGYLLVVEGRDVAGGAFLAIGTPLLAVLSDRIFRRLR